MVRLRPWSVFTAPAEAAQLTHRMSVENLLIDLVAHLLSACQSWGICSHGCSHGARFAGVRRTPSRCAT